jgi:hypothetical protein
MKLSIGKAHSLLVGLNAVDRDDKTKLNGDTRLALAININRLQPVVAAYEKARNAVLTETVGEGPLTAVKEAQFSAADSDLRDKEEEFDLRRIAKADLRLEDNPRITGGLIAMLAPMLIDLEG